MSYNSTDEAKTRTGETISQTLLDDAQSIIHSYTNYRWESTSNTRTISGNNKDLWIELESPIISVSSLVIDDEDQTEGTNFDVRKIEGIVKVYGGLPWGYDNIVITYSYGWQSTDQFYIDTINTVKRIESAIALYLKKNPMMVKGFSIEGLKMNMDYQIEMLLSYIPRTDFFGVAGPDNLTFHEDL